MTQKTNYFPFGFQYPNGLTHSESNPDPRIEDIRLRMDYLNKVHARSSLPGHIFASAMALLQKESRFEPDVFWPMVMKTMTMKDLASMAEALAVRVANTPERLDFPNAIALFDCRFVSTKEWEHIRRYSIGGSEAATVLKLSHFQTQISLYHEKKTPYKEVYDIGKEQIFDYGHHVEDYVVGEIASRLGAVVYPEYRMFAHQDYPFLTCNPDAILLFPDGHLELFEAKTAFWKKRQDWKDGIPDYYAPQPRHYLEVLDDPRLNNGRIGVCLGGSYYDIICHSYQRDKLLGATQIQAEVAYWNNHIVTGILPPLSGDPELDLEAVYGYIPHVDGTSVDILPDEAAVLFERYYDLQAARKTVDMDASVAHNRETDLLDEIRHSVPEGITVCTSDGRPSIRVKVVDRKMDTVNEKMLVLNNPEAKNELQELAIRIKEKSLTHTTPKISKIKKVL